MATAGTTIVIDTNVLVAALKSRRGASFAILEKVQQREVGLHLSVPLVLEYEEVLSRPEMSSLEILYLVCSTIYALLPSYTIFFIFGDRIFPIRMTISSWSYLSVPERHRS